MLVALSPQSVVALDILTPLFQRVERAGDSLGTLGSVEELCAVASAIIAAGGQDALPRPAAGALVQLLSCEGVIAQLPAEHVLQAVRYGLPRQQQGSGSLPDATADALAGRLVAYEAAGVSRLRASLLVHGCGASRSVVAAAARALLQEAATSCEALTDHRPEDLLDALVCLVPRGGAETASSAAAQGDGQWEGHGGVVGQGASLSAAELAAWILLLEGLCSSLGDSSACTLTVQLLQDVAQALAARSAGPLTDALGGELSPGATVKVGSPTQRY